MPGLSEHKQPCDSVRLYLQVILLKGEATEPIRKRVTKGSNSESIYRKG